MNPVLSNPAAFEELFRQNYPSLCRYVYLYTRDKDQSEDIVQEVFINLWQKREKLIINGSPESYLRTSCRNASLNYLQRNVFPAQLDEVPEKGDTNAHLELELAEADQSVTDAVGKLPAACRTVYLMVREEGLSYSEVSDQLNISKKTVENQMSKAIAVLKKLLLNKVMFFFLAIPDIFKKFF